MRAAALPLLFVVVAGCGNSPDNYGGQWRDGPWQQPRLVGCSAEIIVRAPTTLLSRLNEWPLKAPRDNPCPMGTLTVEAPIADFLPWVSPATRRELEALMALGRERALATSKLADEELRQSIAEHECSGLRIQFDPNHADPVTGQLAAKRMQPPRLGGRTEFQDNPITRYGLTGFGRVVERSVRIDPATGQTVETRFPISLSRWRLDEPDGGGLSFNCHYPLYPQGVCHGRKDHSRGVLLHYSMCMALLPDWRAVDRAVGMVANDWVVSEQLVKYAKD